MADPASKTRYPTWSLVGLLALALVLRLLYLYQYAQSPAWEFLTVDNWYHHNWALSLAEGNIFGDTTYFRAPFYAYCLGLLYSLAGSSLWVGRLFGLVIGLGTVALAFGSARRLAGPAAARVSGLLAAVFPISIYFESELLLDPLYGLLLLATIYGLIRFEDSNRRRWLLVAGLLLGLSAITRPLALAVLPVVVLWLVLSVKNRHGYRSGGWSAATVFVLAGLIPVLPITIRNVVMAGDPVVVASQGGINFYLGNNPEADGMSAAMPEPYGYNWQISQITYVAEEDLGRSLKPGEVSTYWRDRALAWIFANPAEAARLTARKFGLQFSDREISNNRALQPHLSAFGVLAYNPISFALLLALAVLAIAGYRARPAGVWLLTGVIFVHILVISLFFFTSRFRLPLLPLYMVLAGCGLAWLPARLSRLRPGDILMLILAAAAGVFAYWSPIGPQQRSGAQPLMSQGLFYYNNGQLATALNLFEQAHDLDPTFPEVNLNRGVCLLRMGRTHIAESALKQEVKLHPHRPTAYANLASLYLLTDRAEAAIGYSARAVELAPYSEVANRVRLRSMGQSREISSDSLAAAVYQAAVATDSNLWVLNEGAAHLVARESFDAAITILHIAEHATPPPIETDDFAFGPGFKHLQEPFERERARTWYLLGFCMAQRGDFEAAVHYSRGAILRDSLMFEAYINLAAGYRTTGRLRQADSVLDEAARRFPDRIGNR